MRLRVAILGGGLATRLGPLSASMPKSLVEVAGRPFADHQIRLLAASGITEIVYCVGHLGEMVEQALGDGHRWGVKLRFSYDGPSLLGTGGALRKALPLLGEAFFVLYGDAYLECDYAAIENAFYSADLPALMTILRNRGRWDRSNVLYRHGRIARYDKVAPSSDMEYIDYGLAVLRSSVLRQYPENEAFDLRTVYEELVAKNQVAAFVVTQRFYEIGSPEGIRETEEHLRGHC